MEVKVYREPENADLIYDEERQLEFHTLMTELGLQAPKETHIPAVYVCMNSAMLRQLTAICPSHTEIQQYVRTTIPIEVLRVYKLAKDNEMYEGFEIWHDNLKPDPMLIGWKYNDSAKNSWNRTYYLLARWGDCALELPELLKLGFDRIKQKLIDDSQEALITLNFFIKDPERYARKIVEGTQSGIYISF